MSSQKAIITWKNNHGDNLWAEIEHESLTWGGTMNDEGKMIPLQPRRQTKNSFLTRGPATTFYPWFKTEIPIEKLQKICELLSITPAWLKPLPDTELAIFESQGSQNTQQSLDQGISPDCTDRFGFTPLWYALHDKDEKKAITLIKYGADVHKNFPLPGEEGNLLFIATKRDELEAVELLLSKEVDITTTDNEGKTVLFYLSTTMRGASVAETLIKHGAEINHTDNNGNIPLHYYAENFSAINLITTLINHGANVNLKNNYGRTPLFNLALYYRLYKDLYGYQFNEVRFVAKKFISAGADTDIIDKTGVLLEKLLSDLNLK